jgi:WD40 repeat protein
MPEGKLQATLAGHGASVNSVAFSTDGKRLASGSGDKTIKLWSVPEGDLQATLAGHAEWVNTVAFSLDGKWLASGDSGGYLILWELDEPKRRWALFDPAVLGDQIKIGCFDERQRVLAGIVCTCDLVCTCNTVWCPAGGRMPDGSTCVCNLIAVGPLKVGGQGQSNTTRTMQGSVCSCDKVCTCNTICTCNAISSGVGGGGSHVGGGGGGGGGGTSSHYWYPT